MPLVVLLPLGDDGLQLLLCPGQLLLQLLAQFELLLQLPTSVVEPVRVTRLSLQGQSVEVHSICYAVVLYERNVWSVFVVLLTSRSTCCCHSLSLFCRRSKMSLLSWKNPRMRSNSLSWALSRSSLNSSI